MNAPEMSPFQIPRKGKDPGDFSPHGVSTRGNDFLAVCVVLSILLHAVLIWNLELRMDVDPGRQGPIMVDLVRPHPPKPQPASPPPVALATTPPEPAAVTAPARDHEPKASPKPRQAKAAPQARKPARSVPRQAKAVAVSEQIPPRPEKSAANEPAAVPIGRLAERPGVTILANESGQDTLKHGAEARFMHGVATEEFVEENYVGEYALSDSSRVWIEDDRANSGHLILHAEGMDLHRKLYRFNRFIYVYGDTSESPSPILGSVTFFSDGYHIHQFMWQHNSTQAYFPRRN